MKPSPSHPSFKAIRTMIHELVRGNFSYRLTEFPGELSEIGLMLNLLADELSTFFVHPNSFGEKDLPDPFVFVLDRDYKICGVNHRFSSLVGQSKEVLIGSPLEDYISAASFEKFHQQLSEVSGNQALAPVRFLLSFESHYRGESWGYCHIVSGTKDTYYIIRGTKLISKPPEASLRPNSPPQFPATLQLRSDIEKIRAVHRYVLSHLDEPLLSLPLLSRCFLINEYKLKNGFKALFHTTIFKLHREKRLAQALVMIKSTPTSIMVIAHSFGFKSLPHFAKAFKKKYGRSPRYYR